MSDRVARVASVPNRVGSSHDRRIDDLTASDTDACSHSDDPMNRIDALFTRLKREGRRALMPFVTAGDPDLPTTAALITELVGRGAHMVEVGIPYSDPIADGPVIAASYHRASSAGSSSRTSSRRSGRSAPRPLGAARRPRRWSRWSPTRSSTGRASSGTSARRRPPGSTA